MNSDLKGTHAKDDHFKEGNNLLRVNVRKAEFEDFQKEGARYRPRSKHERKGWSGGVKDREKPTTAQER